MTENIYSAILLLKNRCSAGRGIVMKRYKIKSKFRFTIFIAALVIIALSSYMGIIGIIDAQGNTVEQYDTVYVTAGESIWTLVDGHVPDNMDKREYVYHVAKYNDITPGDIKPDDEIKLPIY